MIKAAIIYARSGSKRLPGKCNLEVTGSGIRLIDWIILRARMLKVNKVILATTSNSSDDNLSQYIRNKYPREVAIFRDHPEDLIERTLRCLDKYKINQFARINGDSPFFPTSEINKAFETLASDSKFNFVTNLTKRTFPYGVAVEVLNSEYYRTIALKNYKKSEHLTKHLYKLNNEQISKLYSIIDYSSKALTVDTLDDYVKICDLVRDKNLTPESDWRMAI